MRSSPARRSRHQGERLLALRGNARGPARRRLSRPKGRVARRVGRPRSEIRARRVGHRRSWQAELEQGTRNKQQSIRTRPRASREAGGRAWNGRDRSWQRQITIGKGEESENTGPARRRLSRPKGRAARRVGRPRSEKKLGGRAWNGRDRSWQRQITIGKGEESENTGPARRRLFRPDGTAARLLSGPRSEIKSENKSKGPRSPAALAVTRQAQTTGKYIPSSSSPCSRTGCPTRCCSRRRLRCTRWWRRSSRSW